jgi:molybdopterin molybdotransferase
LAEAAGRVLAQDSAAPADIPAEARSARDGYAVQAADTLGAGDYNPLPLQLVPATLPVERGCAARVADGDPLPPGADAVLSIEQGDARGAVLEVRVSLPCGDGVIAAGEECAAGELLLSAGRRLRPQDLARLALAGLTEVSVQRRPRVFLALAGHFDIDADSPLLAALINRDGGQLTGTRPVSDETALIDVLQQSDADLILVAGGTGRGPQDFALDALHRCGAVHLDGVAIHPGGGVVLGQTADAIRPVLLLPGAPLACLCAYDLIAARVLRRLSGRPSALPYRRRALTLRRKIASSIGRLELARLRITGDTAEPIATADGRTLATAIHADGFLLIPEQSEGYPPGSRIEPYLYDDYD